MPEIIEAKLKTDKPLKSKKVCLKCGQARQLTEFYANKDWKQQLGKDVWCKQCVNRCTTKDQIKQYFFVNQRQWHERIWQAAEFRAKKLVATNQTYARSSADRQAFMLERLTAQQVPACMTSYYNHIDTSQGGQYLYYHETKTEADVMEENPNVRTYSQKWNGNFTKAQLEYLNSYYEQLEENFSFTDASTRDYARKVCRASMQSNKAMDDFLLGKCDYTAVKDALNVFDMLNKSANFAACKRKAGDNSGTTSYGEFVAKWESSGLSVEEMERKIEWPQDDVDRCIKSLYHIVDSLNLDTV